jgi:predicted transposase YbfD/YdcC
VVEGEEVDSIRETTKFPGIALILRVDSEVKKSGVVTGLETRHFVARLKADEASPKRLMDAVRGHWGVENGLHFIKDRWWDEDRQWSTRPGLAERLATLRDGALAALRLIPGLPDNLPIRGRADHLSRSLRKALRFIGALK